MPVIELLQAVNTYTHDSSNAWTANTQRLAWRLAEVFLRTWDLGFTAFGGPPVHFKILHERFVGSDGVSKGGYSWLDEQTYQELFAISQALPGPASTKMVFCIVLIHAGIVPALFTFAMWCFPGAMVMYGLSLGVQKISTILPGIVYALLSGMNASTVGIIALAAVQLAEKAINDKLTRILVIFGACAGLCYSALWYFPLLITVGGIATLTWDLLLRRQIARLRAAMERRKTRGQDSQPGDGDVVDTDPTSVEMVDLPESSSNMHRRRQGKNVDQASAAANPLSTAEALPPRPPNHTVEVTPAPTTTSTYGISAKMGCIVIAIFFVTFIIVMSLRGTPKISSLGFRLFANFYLAGTIIFGGGPVVIPLLREYVVDPGWVSPRDFLLGLAIIQALPGPNFNFGIYLGALALANTSTPTIAGAIIGSAIFIPGIVFAIVAQSLWRTIRSKAWVSSLLRGINATAVGLVFTAVYRLWEIGYLTPEQSNGQSLASEPWWVVVAAVTYAGTAWFKIPPAVAIIGGAILGMMWYGVVST